MYKHTFYYFLGNKKYPEIYILLDENAKLITMIRFYCGCKFTNKE